MKLFYTKRSPFALVVRVLAAEIDVTLELEEAEVRNADAALLQFTPAGRVPAIQMSDGSTIADHRICVKIIADTADRPDIFSQNHHEMAAEGEACALMEAYIRRFQESWRDEAQQSESTINIEEARINRLLHWFEAHTESLGTKVNYRTAVVACALYFNEHYSKLEGVGPDFPKLLAWYQATINQPAYQKIIG